MPERTPAGELAAHGDQGDIMLVTGKLNLVGENHKESDARRTQEEIFCLATTLSPNYWTESQFPDLAKASDGVAAWKADLTEYRAVNGAAALIQSFVKLGDQGVGVSAVGDARFPAELADFSKKFAGFLEVQKWLDGTWRPSSSTVDKAVTTAYSTAHAACQAYQTALSSPGWSSLPVQRQQKVLRDFVNVRVDLAKMVPELAGLVGAKLADPGSAEQLRVYLRTERSAFMGLAAVNSWDLHNPVKGVWKVGNRHVLDLSDGTKKVDLTRFNLVTQEQFNEAFAAWQARQPK